MTDLEISKQLALAIGWPKRTVLNHPDTVDCWVWTGSNWRVFDYRDWNVIGPIAAKYDAFPQFCDTGEGKVWWVYGFGRNGIDAGQGAATPQKAIAMAVIVGAAK